MTITSLTSLRAAGPAFDRTQRAGPLSMVPVFGPVAERFPPPQSSVKLSKVHTYGRVELEARVPPGARGPTRTPIIIVPLHLGYVQDGAQNHALARSHLMLEGQHYVFEDAFCVQQGQGGFLEGREQTFFILPQQLRGAALAQRSTVSYSRLWSDIARLCESLGLASRGHLEQLINRQRAYLTQFASRFEVLPGQTGALFFHGQRLAGVELTPTPEWFAEAFPALACFSYGPLAFNEEVRTGRPTPEVAPLPGTTLAEIREALLAERAAAARQLMAEFDRVLASEWTEEEEEEVLGVSLHTAGNRHFTGQVVRDEGNVVYASLTRRAVA